MGCAGSTGFLLKMGANENKWAQKGVFSRYGRK
jgi:hypothetical protein